MNIMELLKKHDKSQIEPRNELNDKIYDYLRKNAIGRLKRVKSSVLMQKFNITDNKTLRSHIESIRDDMEYELIVCSEAGQQGGYWIATSDEEVTETLKHLYKRSMKMLYTYSKLRKKSRLNKQQRLQLDKDIKEIYNSIMEVK